MTPVHIIIVIIKQNLVALNSLFPNPLHSVYSIYDTTFHLKNEIVALEFKAKVFSTTFLKFRNIGDFVSLNTANIYRSTVNKSS